MQKALEKKAKKEQRAKKENSKKTLTLIEKMLKRGDTISEITDFLEISVEEVEKAKEILE